MSCTGHDTLMQYSFIHFGHLYSAPSSSLLLRVAPDYSTDTVSKFHGEAHRQLQVKDLPFCLYVAARAGVEPTTLRLKVIVSTTAPPRPANIVMKILIICTVVHTYM